MSVDDVIVAGIFRSALIYVLFLVGPILLVSLIVGLILSIVQATTSLQEQTITLVPKLLAIFLTLFYFGPRMFAIFVNYVRELFTTISQIIG